MKLFERWRSSTDAARFEGYTWWSIVILLWTVPLLLLAAVGSVIDGVEGPATEPVVQLAPGVPMIVLVVLGVLHSVAAVRATRDSFAIRLGRGGSRTGSVPGLVATTLVTAATGVLVLPITTELTAGAGFVVMVVLTATLAATGARWTARQLALALLPAVAVMFLVHVPVRGAGTEQLLLLRIPDLAIMAGFAYSVWLSAWMVQVVRRLEDAREVESRLAVAEERLRFSRDLHDTLGRSLSAIAVKSELAAELAHRGRPEAAAEMASVRDLAHQVLTEARSVAAGYRRVNLTDELEGARSLLRSTGAVTSVTGDVSHISDAAQEVLAWAVREGVTNVVRHSSARRVDLTIEEKNGMAILALTNDAVTPGTATGGGSGLGGLAERVARVGGSLTTDQVGDQFTLRASVPAGLGSHGPASQDRSAMDGREPTSDRTGALADADSEAAR